MLQPYHSAALRIRCPLRPDRFSGHLARLESLSAYGLGLAHVILKPVGSDPEGFHALNIVQIRVMAKTDPLWKVNCFMMRRYVRSECHLDLNKFNAA